MKKPPQWVAVGEERTAALAGLAGGMRGREETPRRRWENLSEQRLLLPFARWRNFAQPLEARLPGCLDDHLQQLAALAHERERPGVVQDDALALLWHGGLPVPWSGGSLHRLAQSLEPIRRTDAPVVH